MNPPYGHVDCLELQHSPLAPSPGEEVAAKVRESSGIIAKQCHIDLNPFSLTAQSECPQA